MGESIDTISKVDLLHPNQIDGLKMIEKLNNDSIKFFNYEDKHKKAKFDKLRKKYLYGLTDWNVRLFGIVVDFLRTLESLEEEAAVDLKQEFANLEDYSPLDILNTCTRVLGKYNSNFEACQYFNQTGYEFERFFGYLELTEYIETGDKIPEVASEIENYMMAIKKADPMDTLAEDQQLIEKILSYGDDLQNFIPVRNIVNQYVSFKNRVGVSHYPESRRFPERYFPMNGYEESPLVAIKLHLQGHKRLVHNLYHEIMRKYSG